MYFMRLFICEFIKGAFWQEFGCAILMILDLFSFGLLVITVFCNSPKIAIFLKAITVLILELIIRVFVPC